MRNQRFLAVLGVILVAGTLLASCAPILNQGRDYNLVITLGSTARALSDAPSELDFPVFDTVSITVASGSTTVASRTYITPQSGYTMSVPEGGPYTVTVVATPKRDPGDPGDPFAEPPIPPTPPTPQIFFARSYSGTTTGVTVSATPGAPVTIAVSLSDSVILLPDSYSGYLSAATSLADLNPAQNSGQMGINPWSDFAFDPYGRLYLSEMFSLEGDDIATLRRYDNLGGAEVNPLYSDIVEYDEYINDGYTIIGSNAFSPLDGGRLYYTTLRYPAVGDPVARLEYVQLYEDPVVLSMIDLPLEIATIYTGDPEDRSTFPKDKLPVAVDAAGAVYLKAVLTADPTVPVIAKLADPTGGQTLTSASYASLGLTATNLVWDGVSYVSQTTVLNVEDLQVVGDYLYIFASDVYASGTAGEYPSGSLKAASRSRGKIVKVDISNLTKVAELGWREDLDKLPQNSDDTDLYGPRRVVGLTPKKLYIMDVGFYYYDDMSMYPYNDYNRVVELDLDSFTLTGFGLADMSDLSIENYSSIYAYYNYGN